MKRRAHRIGEVLSVEDVSLAFGGVKALQDVSFDVREHEVRAIIGPNGAGKSSMLNVLNGVYHPQQGKIRFTDEEFHDMDSHEAAALGIARTFQNIALFKGMTVLDNIMTGRNLKMRCNFLQQALWIGPAKREEIAAPPRGRGDHRLPRDPAHPQDAGRAGCPTACRSASSSAARSPPSRRCCCSTSRWRA